jgi:predicted helicase
MSELANFYKSVRERAEGIDNAEGRQKVIIELYNTFFKAAFPKMSEMLGIVYTPVEVVDFIVQSANDVLQAEFGRRLTDKNVNIFDPFTGTGTFITRLLQSGLIEKTDLPRKYESEIFANEIVLLAYYIACVNIENAYHDIIGADEYAPFGGIALTDTFQAWEASKDQQTLFDENSERVRRQNETPITVIFGNPPYSVGQKSANDNAQNKSYATLDEAIAKSYAALSEATNKNALYDSYIRAFRYSTDRLRGGDGIICFVSNGSWLDGNSTAGFRKALEQEFAKIYVFNLRGNARTSGELRRKEAGNVFESGSRTPVSITLLVKRRDIEGKAEILYRDIGDYLKREEKLAIVAERKSFLNPDMGLARITPNEHGDWITTRNEAFNDFVPLASEKKFDEGTESVFVVESNGIKTNRDIWVYNFSKTNLTKKVSGMINFFNEQIVAETVSYDSTKISWSGILEDKLKRTERVEFEQDAVATALYRPFTKQRFYYSDNLIERRYQFRKLFPTPDTKNMVVCVSGIGVTKDFSVLISDKPTDLEFIGKSRCFPLYYYEEKAQKGKKSQTVGQLDMFGEEEKAEIVRKDGISDFILQQARLRYGSAVKKEDIFYYVYGFLHSPKYRTTFADDLKKSLPRLPLVDKADDFWAFSKAGRELAKLHLEYENMPPLAEVTVNRVSRASLHVGKMRFANDKKDEIAYNAHISVQNIPAKAYEYIVNGKSAIEWVMERYQVKTDKDSGIVNDPNLYAEETGQPEYILNLLLSVISVSVRTQEIVEGLPEVKWE